MLQIKPQVTHGQDRHVRIFAIFRNVDGRYQPAQSSYELTSARRRQFDLWSRRPFVQPNP
ncbi:hypothetical protein PS723_00528 [Pseudomonas fluorescens]|uniref:Uncharacterized protein n=1 Tax=Pseudomonas fluorescens TaxID=294 RepID=A0A5E7A2C6_PSEFL|nr:hypothetical protein PS723_00528 [Pseudomonas fluorescens]